MAKFICLDFLVIMAIFAAVLAGEMFRPLLSIVEEAMEQLKQQQIGRMNEKPAEKVIFEEKSITKTFPSVFRNDNELIRTELLKNKRRSIILTILLIKLKKPDEYSDNLDQILKQIFKENLSKITQFKSQVSKIFSKLTGLSAKFEFDQPKQQLIGESSQDMEKNRGVDHLLGSHDEIDSVVFKQNKKQEGTEEKWYGFKCV